ncbi:MAG: hypothetical protein RJA76_1584 [Bacteroidota bacterium]|jgi:hypothetical protein
MKTIFLTIFTIYLGFSASQPYQWGFFAHKKINYLAVFTLPPPLNTFFKKNIELIQEYAVLPDERRYVLENEAERHYIDLDHYNITTIQFKSEKQVIKNLPEDSINAHGKVVWYIPIAYQKLINAFQEKDSEKIIKYAAELGHYVADAHVPLHTTSNYDGQKTDQVGIHSFWESRIPELINRELETWIGPAEYIANVQEKSWEIILSSHSLVKDLLGKEKKLSYDFKASKKYSFEQKGNQLIKNYSKEYAIAYHKMLNNSIENRFNESVKVVGSLWYSAWLESGQPDIP